MSNEAKLGTVPKGDMVFSRKALVHGVANCLCCDWECSNYLDVQSSAQEHAKWSGHNVSVELGYSYTVSVK